MQDLNRRTSDFYFWTWTATLSYENFCIYILDPIVRSELMEQIPHVAVYCQENRDIFQNAIPVYILPMVVRYLDDANNQVFIYT